MEKEHLRGRSVGFVPTMGALHEGHLSLVKRAAKENDLVAVSIFVNPLQFGPREDLKRYPRPLLQDKKLLQKQQVDYLFLPKVQELYPEGFQTHVQVGSDKSSLSRELCAKSRPGHFEGVATVVAKLLNLAKPKRAYFGEKDFQQAAIIRRMVLDLDMNTEIRICPIVREKDGLALSSRNRYLSAMDRARAVFLSRTLFELRDALEKDQGASFKAALRDARKGLAKHADRVDYLEVIDPETLQILKKKQPEMQAAAACWIGKTRLIDNIKIRTLRKYRK